MFIYTYTLLKRFPGTYDFFGLNHYSSVYVYHQDRDINDVSYEADKETAGYNNPDWLT